MSVWTNAELTVIYTLTPLHYGVGQAASAVDLPIAREAGTGFPLLPATGLKGVARDFLARDAGDGNQTVSMQEIKRLFGPDLDGAEGAENVETGALTFTEARLLAYPARSLNRPFVHLTCPLILERLARDLRALDVGSDLVPKHWSPSIPSGRALAASTVFAGDALVIEDLVYDADEVTHSDELQQYAGKLAELLPSGENATRRRLESGLVMIPDTDFADLVARIPVRARIKLTDGKTTDAWVSPAGEIQKGNLWYEEHLPPDCMFAVFVGERRQRSRGSGMSGKVKETENEQVTALNVLRRNARRLCTVQIGGNETVGFGLCWWSGWKTER